MSAAVNAVPQVRHPRFRQGSHSIDTTLLELVQAIGEVTEDDREIVATVLHLLRSGRVRLTGNFRGRLTKLTASSA